MNPKIAFFGTPKIAAQVLEKLAKSPHKPHLVITGQDQHLGRSLALKASAVKLVAEKHNIAISYKMSDINKSFDLAILVAYGHIIPDSVLRKPKYGFINVHPSLLPKYRGPSPIISAILAGDKITGSTLIILDSDLDHGPIIAQKELAIATNDTHDSLAGKLAALGAQLLIRTLPDYLHQNISPNAQNHDEATYTEKITKASGKIDIDNPPEKVMLNRMIRAYYPWPTVWTEVDGKRFKLLPEGKIQPEGKKPMTLKEFSNGYRLLANKFKNVLAN
ncbi:MAG: methionyl-tRNA formyltransferase [Patescibacteria group bacterium]|mgnify:CR=1 FL=1